MRSNYRWYLTGLSHSILVGLLLLLGIYGQDNGSDCYPEIRVQRNTVWKASPGDCLEINCPVIICTNSSSSFILWRKIIGSEWVPVKRTALIEIKWQRRRNNGTSFLVFKRIDVNDSGLYQCILETAGSHSINVTVTESVEDSTVVNQKNETNITPGQRDSFLEVLWLYVYKSAVLVVFVIMVLTIFMLSKHGCKGVCPSRQPKIEEQPERQNIAIPVSPRPKPSPHQAQQNRRSNSPPDSIYENITASDQHLTCAAANQVAAPVEDDCTDGTRKWYEANL
uniref:Ig-like domain-containing protein n=1 Tax=Esox lucius TaxID=8010 RepID=A0AAY5KE54_ESOLU